MNKIYVLDTNVLLNDPLAVLAFKGQRAILPMTVLQELDDIKDRRDKDVSRDAMLAIKTIDSILGSAPAELLEKGVSISEELYPGHGGSLSVFHDVKRLAISNEAFGFYGNKASNDDWIINTAIFHQQQHPEASVVLVTKDINMRIKAKAAGLLLVEDYRKERVIDDIESLSSGYVLVEDFWGSIDSCQSHMKGGAITVPTEMLSGAHASSYIIDDSDYVAYVSDVGASGATIEPISKKSLFGKTLWGIKPRNLEQALAMHALCHDNNDLISIAGPAGSGKTLLALAYALHMSLEAKSFDRVILTRSPDTLGADIGFLPGTEEDKMRPLLAAFEDALDVLHGEDDNVASSIEYVRNKANIQMRSINFMRGRSFQRTLILVDEAQNLSAFQMKSLVTRVGAGSKMIILGNLAQIDNRFLSPLTSGLTHLIAKAKDYSHAAHIHVNGVERSRLAAFAEQNL